MAVLMLLLLVATWFDGAFDLQHWAPVAMLALAMLASALAVGGLRVDGRYAWLALASIWSFAGWATLSATWGESAGGALEGGGRTLLYASLFTLAVAVPIGRRAAALLGGAAMAGLVVIAAVTLVDLLGDGSAEFLAGRLDDPVGYRNGTACLFGLAFWPLVSAASARVANPVLRGLAFAAAVLVLGLAFLTEARGVVLGLAVGGVVAIGLGPDRLRRAWVALIAVAAIAAISDELLTPYRAFVAGAPEAAADIATAVDALTAVVVGAALVGFTAAVLDGGLRLSDAVRVATRRVAAGALAGLALAAVAVTLVAIGDPLTFASDRFDEFRSLDTAAPGETRLTFGGGQRADLWRIALAELSERPLTGVGEGGYRFDYYEQRRTDRNVATPHGLPLAILAEKGAVGALAFLAFLAAVAGAVAAPWRTATAGARRAASALLAGSAVVLSASMVDWIWFIPGVMGLGFLLAGLAVAALAPRPAPGGATGPSRYPVATRTAAAVMAAVAALGVTLLYLSDADVRRARAADATAAERLSAARGAERLNRWSVTPLYLQAGALEELGRRDEARGQLIDALELEPANFVTAGLLGDLELRAGRQRAAGHWYGRALRLNPRDVGLRELARRTRAR